MSVRMLKQNTGQSKTYGLIHKLSLITKCNWGFFDSKYNEYKTIL